MVNCSAAAARKVSPAASRVVVPSAVSRLASLPIVVVFPTPLTPTKSQIDGPESSRRARERSAPSSRPTISSRSAEMSDSGSSISPDSTPERRPSRRSVVTPIPMSESRSASSNSSHTSASIAERPSTDPSAPPSAARARPSRSRMPRGAGSGSTEPSFDSASATDDSTGRVGTAASLGRPADRFDHQSTPRPKAMTPAMRMR